MAAICSCVRSISPSGSANSTKSLPVPWPLVNWSDVVIGSILPHCVEGDLFALRIVRFDPHGVRISLEPTDLPARIFPGEHGRLLDRLVLRQLAAQLAEGLGVAD